MGDLLEDYFRILSSCMYMHFLQLLDVDGKNSVRQTEIKISGS
jgi:hypothetical protein